MKRKRQPQNYQITLLKILNNGFIWSSLSPYQKLTQSSYQVTTFLDFLPFLQGFTRVNDYIENYRKDLNNPTYTHQIPMELYNVEFALHNNTEMSCLMDSSLCRTRPHQCMTAFKIKKFKEELSYVQEIFLCMYNRFPRRKPVYYFLDNS